MKKGFTLIELLAVIVILAVIAVISSPIIIGVIDNSRKESYKDSAYGILDALKYKYAQSVMNGETIGNTNLLDSLSYNGKKPETGTAKLDAVGNTGIALKYGNYCLFKDFSDVEVSVLEYNVTSCSIVNLETVNILYEEITSSGSELNNNLFTRLAYGDYSNDISGIDYKANEMPLDNGVLNYTAGSGTQNYFGFEFTSPITYSQIESTMELTCDNCKGNLYFDAILVDETNLSSSYYDITWINNSTAFINNYADFVSGHKYKILFAASGETISFSVSYITMTSLYYDAGNLLYDCDPESTSIVYENPIDFLDIDGVDVSDKIVNLSETLPNNMSEVTKSNYVLSYQFKTSSGIKNLKVNTVFQFRYITEYNNSDLVLTSYLPSELTAKKQTCSAWSGQTCLSPGPIETITGGTILENGNILYIYKGQNLLYTEKIVIYINN